MTAVSNVFQSYVHRYHALKKNSSLWQMSAANTAKVNKSHPEFSHFLLCFRAIKEATEYSIIQPAYDNVHYLLASQIIHEISAVSSQKLT